MKGLFPESVFFAWLFKDTGLKIKILCILIVLFFSASVAAETTIRITNGEWEPYMSEFSPHYGFASHVVSEAFKLEGIKIIWRFYPWKRSFIAARKGADWDASCCWWPSKEIGKDFFISEPVSKSSVVFFHLKGYKFDWQSMDDLTELKIGGTFEYEYSPDFMTAMTEKKIFVDLVPSDELNYRKLLGGRIDLFPNDPVVGYSQIRNSFSSETVKRFTHHPKELQSTTLNLIISKRCKNGRQLLETFNTGLKKLRTSGQYERMFDGLMIGAYDKKKIK